MKITFKNLDKKYIKGKREFIGDIQPKFWYMKKAQASEKVLVKRQHSQSMGANKPKSRMFNHIGEYFGYKIAEKAGLNCCPVDLVTLHDKKNRFSDKILFYTACASHSLKKDESCIIPGEVVVSDFCNNRSNEYKMALAEFMDNHNNLGFINSEILENNVDFVIASIVNETINIEKNFGKRTSEEIANDCSENIKNAIEMIVYDCIFGNHDRHSGNWSMEIDADNGKATMYPMYDNEAVLGLRMTENEVQNILNSDNPNKEIDEKLCSRMGFGKESSKISYKKMLEHLVQKYPEYAIPSIQKITSRVDEEFIRDLYDGLNGISTRGDHADELTEKDELPEFYRKLGMITFRTRRNYTLDLLKRVKSINTIPGGRTRKKELDQNNVSGELELV